MDGILEGIHVVDFSAYVTGSFATTMLSNLGADVIKVERPDAGDPSRRTDPQVDGESGYFMTLNYGKKSIGVDMKSEEGREIVYDLVADCDVFIQNYRPGVARKLNVGYETLSDINDELVYCSISGFGDNGPWSDRAGLDLLMQALSGLMDVNGEPDGEPVKIPVPQTDLITAMWAAFGITAALYRREQTNEGEYIDLGMFDAVVPWLTKQAAVVFQGGTPTRMGTRDPAICPYQAYEAKDGYIVVGAGTEKLWTTFCAVIDREDLLADERFTTNESRLEHVDELEREIEQRLKQKPVDEWVELLDEQHGIPASSIQTIGEALENEQVRARGMVTDLEHAVVGDYPVLEHPLNFEKARSGFERHAPALGEHTREVLSDLGYDEDEIARLASRDVVSST